MCLTIVLMIVWFCSWSWFFFVSNWKNKWCVLYCSELQCVAVYKMWQCNTLQSTTVHCDTLQHILWISCVFSGPNQYHCGEFLKSSTHSRFISLLRPWPAMLQTHTHTHAHTRTHARMEAHITEAHIHAHTHTHTHAHTLTHIHAYMTHARIRTHMHVYINVHGQTRTHTQHSTWNIC